ncbi:MAG TPA: hypothetical protein VH640_20910 [Bryobacteraceae bacterium]|jgi:hypothetical protein
MSQKSHLIFAFVAGMAGAAVMHYAAPTLALAQDQTPVTKEIRAQSFALVDASNNVVGTFTSEPVQGVTIRWPGTPSKVPSHIVLRDPNGRVIWTPDASTKMLPLAMR